jgi:hypothetical protein
VPDRVQHEHLLIENMQWNSEFLEGIPSAERLANWLQNGPLDDKNHDLPRFNYLLKEVMNFIAMSNYQRYNLQNLHQKK